MAGWLVGWLAGWLADRLTNLQGQLDIFSSINAFEHNLVLHFGGSLLISSLGIFILNLAIIF